MAMWLCTLLLVGPWSSLGLVPNYVVLVPSNEGGGPSSHARSSYMGPKDWLRKLVVMTLNIKQIFN
jgi:hypothetical protein